jgi:hypothetical protein
VDHSPVNAHNVRETLVAEPEAGVGDSHDGHTALLGGEVASFHFLALSL